jgi:hypothetical protein
VRRRVGPPSQRGDLVQSPWPSGRSAPPGRRDRVEDLPTVNTLSREAAAGGRQDQEQELNLSTVDATNAQCG